jgi:hypothetical protein
MIACVGGLVEELTYGRRNRNVGVICSGTIDRRTVKIGVEWYGKKASNTSSVLHSCTLVIAVSPVILTGQSDSHLNLLISHSTAF